MLKVNQTKYKETKVIPIPAHWKETMLGEVAEIQTLSRLQDALLLKLMKGEIRVKDVEKITKETI